MKTSVLLNRLIKAHWVCNDCGIHHGSYTRSVSTFHEGKCDICQKKAVVTESRDYGYLQKGRKKVQEALKKEITKNNSPKETIGALQKKLWKMISSEVRNSSSKCYTCDVKLEYSKRSVGHFWPKGSHGAVKFDIDNLRVQCNTCNSFKSGNLAEYGYRLMDEIGIDDYRNLYKKAHTKKRDTKDGLKKLIEERIKQTF